VPTLKKQLRKMRDAELAASRAQSRADLCNPSIGSDLQNG
jgi:hypothetical protein